ncbi:hypothetical protein IX308_000439 [Porphyromonas levii]|uniref:hypothetical protein n=1 Tax=Porphyromonas levii TaxID=28114 RepID=UPI000363083F|nr:hypothetical protein [Porphyromonas levii]MBR8784270.1 hypothetical protein [Porphyromonas levii]
MKKTTKTFILHDESVNTYGFRMLTSGADLEEFKKNPVMFYNHESWNMPIGRWENIRIEGTKILADAVFDLEDEKAAKIAQKVEDDFIRACSVGAWIKESSSDASLLIEGQTGATVLRWVVREASICNIPANHNALALYDADGKRVEEADIATILELTDNKGVNHNKQQSNMKTELTNILRLPGDVREQAIVQAVQSLKDELSGYKQREAEAQKAEAVSLTDAAIREGRLDASAREATLKLFGADHENAKAMLSALPKPVSVTTQIENVNKSEGSELVKMSWDDLDKADKLVGLKDADPELYAEKFRERFGRDPKF